MAQPSSICSSRYVAFVEVIHLKNLLEGVSFLLSINQRPVTLFVMTYRQTTHHKRTAVHVEQASPVKNEERTKILEILKTLMNQHICCLISDLLIILWNKLGLSWAKHSSSWYWTLIKHNIHLVSLYSLFDLVELVGWGLYFKLDWKNLVWY